MNSLLSVVVHVNAPDSEDGILSRRASAPAAVTVGPVVPDPGTSNIRNIASGFENLDAIDIPPDSTCSPVKAVLVLRRGGVGRRVRGKMGAPAVAVPVLVGEPELAGSAVGQRVGVREPLDISLLVVCLVEENS